MVIDSNISISIVSHNHGLLISKLLSDLQMHCSKEIEVILTINTNEKLPFTKSDFNFPLCLIQNKAKFELEEIFINPEHIAFLKEDLILNAANLFLF